MYILSAILMEGPLNSTACAISIQNAWKRIYFIRLPSKGLAEVHGSATICASQFNRAA
jgi:hypothetical protein